MADRLYASQWEDYELLDAGNGKKLERFGSVITIRPELQAYFKSGLSVSEWNRLAHWEFVEQTKSKGYWKALKPGFEQPFSWDIHVDTLCAEVELTKFKHIGIFPEQYANWQFIRNQINPGDRFLNLFAYTGIASIVAKSAGAEVTHVDAVRQLVTWAKKNMEKSGLQDIRWMVEDALKFAQREVKRNHQYQGIIMDPPAFGLGAKGEKWILEEQLPFLLEAAQQLLHPERSFLLLNTYSPKLNLDILKEISLSYFSPDTCHFSELRMRTKSGKDLFYGNLLRVEIGG